MTDLKEHLQIDCEIQFIKTHPDAKLPEKAHFDDNCFDVFAVEDTIIPPITTQIRRSAIGGWQHIKEITGIEIGSAVVPVGLKVAYITPGFGFVIRPKSGLGFKYGLQPHLGEIDTGYRGSLDIKVYNFSNKPYTYKKGDKVAQIKIEKIYETRLSFAEEAVESKRGEGGFGSTGQ